MVEKNGQQISPWNGVAPLSIFHVVFCLVVCTLADTFPTPPQKELVFQPPNQQSKPPREVPALGST